MTRPRLVEADWTWTGAGFAAGVQVEVDASGLITRVGKLGSSPDLRLSGRALLPGFVNAHSHAFQRGLRGRGESFPAGSGSFWSWREAMYALVADLDAQRLQAIARLAFDEMRAAGVTTVGEFHYLHHDDPERRDFAFDEVVLAAAAESGLRLVLLEAYYRTGGIGEPLAGSQRRFAVNDPAGYWRQTDALRGRLAAPLQTLGAVAHSIRAADPGEIVELYQEARSRGLVFHMHMEEQRQEIDACRTAYGSTPLALITERLSPAADFTAVHCTHSTPRDLEAYLENGANICICPLTEANLADGIADLPAMAKAGAAICLGSDSNARISMLEEMRWLEYVQRLARERRGVLADNAGDSAARLITTATAAGATALGLPTGKIEPGLWADFATIDLDHPTLAGWQPETLAASLVFGTGSEAIAGTCIGGDWQMKTTEPSDR